MKVSRFILALLMLCSSVTHGESLDVVDGFAAHSFVAKNGATLPYRMFTPAIGDRGIRYPVIVYLHGIGGAGTDNLLQISGGNKDGTHVWTASSVQARHPAFVIAPQIPVGHEWASPGPSVSQYADLVLQLLNSLAQQFPIDTNRIYLVGQSLGGYGVWDFVTKRPDIVAAVVAVCGGGDRERITSARHTPIWAFHGAKDPVVPVERSRELVAILQEVRGAIKYTEYADAGHDVWGQAFADPALVEWLFTFALDHSPVNSRR